jgi:pyruvate dehydrogenase E1 component alpha subunit
MPSVQADGMSCETVHEAVAEACKRARSGEGPSLIEFKTYRYKGHSMSDPASYRSKDEVEKYKAKDPIEQVIETLRENKWITDKQLEAIEEKVKKEVDECVKFAEESPLPDPSELFKDVYVQDDYPYIVED